MEGMMPLIGGVLSFFEGKDATLKSLGSFLVIWELQIGLKWLDVCKVDVEEETWDSRHCLGDLRPVKAVISMAGLTGGVPEKGRLSCEKDKDTWLVDPFPPIFFDFILELKMISPAECEVPLSILCVGIKRFFTTGFRSACI